MPLPPEFRVTEADGTLRIAWDNRHVAKENWGWLVITWLVFAFATTWGACSLAVWAITGREDVLGGAAPGFLIVGHILIGWFTLYAIPYVFVGRSWKERLEVSRDGVTHSKFGRFAPKPKVYPIAKIDRVMLGWYRSMATGSTDTVRIYVLRKDRGFYGSLVAWLAIPLQAELFFTIRDFVSRNGIPIEMGEWGKRPEWAQKQ